MLTRLRSLGALAKLTLLVGVATHVPAVRAGVPDPPLVLIDPADHLGPGGGALICAPSVSAVLPATVNTFTVRNTMGNPIVGASVVVLFGSANPACPAAVLNGVTDKNGICTITIATGGCSDDVAGSSVVRVNGVTVRAYRNVKGPDFDGAGGNLDVDLSDLVAFADQFNGLQPAACHDYENDQDCDVADLVIFGAAFSGGLACP